MNGIGLTRAGTLWQVVICLVLPLGVFGNAGATDSCGDEVSRPNPERPRVLPRNPYETLNKAGRGKLWRWGANQAADALVIRTVGGRREILLIRRRSGLWAMPGGFKDPGETGMAAAVRELREETGISLPEGHAGPTGEVVAGEVVYEGYVADGRNTDHAWIETTVVAFQVGEEAANWNPRGQDDAQDARWFSVDDPVLQSLHANHSAIIHSTLKRIAQN